jgi:hypothetical protein
VLEEEGADAAVERIALALRQPVDFGPEVDRAVMAALRAAPLRVTRGMSAVRGPARRTGMWSWLVRPRSLRLSVSPIGALAAAAVAIVAALFGLRRDGGVTRSEAMRRTNEFPVPQTGEYAAVPTTSPTSTAHDTVYIQRFMIMAPTAKQVALVGDFNDWNEGATLLRPVKNSSGVWTIDVRLVPGRYHYAFLIDGKEWIADPAAPRVTRDDFGRPSSVVTVVREGRST